MDYGKFRYEQSKKTKPSKRVEVKTLTLRPKTDAHDLGTKLSHARKFLEKGNLVRFVVRMRGRERSHTDRWIKQLNELLNELVSLGQVTQRPQPDGRVIVATIEPFPQKEKPADQPAESQTEPQIDVDSLSVDEPVDELEKSPTDQ